MTVTKKNISKKISEKYGLSLKESSSLLDNFFSIIKTQSSRSKIKISNFGSFYYKETVKRVGRNPKTKESYIIMPRKKLNFRGSNILKKFLNPWKNY